MEDINCCICLEVSLTITSCNHPLCKRCYKKAQTNPQANMQACPCCRRQDYTLVDRNITLDEEQKEAHYKSLMDAYNEDHAFVRPARAVRHNRPNDLLPPERNPDPNWNPRRAAMELNFDDAVRADNYFHARNLRRQLIEGGWELNLVRAIDYQTLVERMRGRWEVAFDNAIAQGEYFVADNLRHELVAIDWVMNEERQHAFEEARLAYDARREARVREAEEARERQAARREAERIARRDARRVERQEQRQIERDAAEAQRAADREAAAEQGVQPNNDGDIVLRTMDDYAALEQRFNARRPAGARARVFLGEGMEIGHLPFNARPMLACVGCNKKTRRVCGACNDAYCCAACNNCENGCAPAFHHPANYQRL
jgi:hypothetical protein